MIFSSHKPKYTQLSGSLFSVRCNTKLHQHTVPSHDSCTTWACTTSGSYQFQCSETNLKIKMKAEAPHPHLPMTSMNWKRSTLSSSGTPSCGHAPSHIMSAVFMSNYMDSTQWSCRHFPGVKCIHSTV